MMRSKSAKIRIYHQGEHPEMMRLDVNKLGRPYHKVPKIFTDKFDQFDGKLSIYFLKKFRVNVALKAMQFQMDSWKKNSQIFISAIGNLGFNIDRALLLNILQDYYGLAKDNQQNMPAEPAPVTKTEERLQNKLAIELVSLLTSDALFGEKLTIKPDYSALITQWTWRIEFTLDGYDQGNFSLLLDAAHVDRLLTNMRQHAADRARLQQEVQQQDVQATFSNLPVRLHGRLATLPLTVAELLLLKHGDILPMALPDRVPLFIGPQPLFNAAIREDRGQLFFSEFSDRTSEQHHD